MCLGKKSKSKCSGEFREFLDMLDIEGPQGPAGPRGPMGFTGPVGSRGPAGVTYTRWGRTTCPNTPGTETLYSGRAGGTLNTVQGGTSSYLCLSDSPLFLDTEPGLQMPAGQKSASIHGAEYEDPIIQDTDISDDDGVPCAVCYTSERSAIVMIQGRFICPPTWTGEYSGYLMTERDVGFYRREIACVDRQPERIMDRDGFNGALFYHTEATCNGLVCSDDRYVKGNELTCAICTK